MTITMYDDITLSALPGGAAAYAGYVNGHWANWDALKTAHGAAHLLDISVFASGDATCLDVETGDATIGQVYGWFKRQRARSVYRPVIYTSGGNLSALYATMKANGFARGSYRVWSAHYSNEHICGPSTCGFNLGGSAADGTQWTDVALGRSLDESLLAGNFFAKAPPVPTPVDPHPASGPPFRHVADGTKSLNAVAGQYKETGGALVTYNATAPFDPKNREAFDKYVGRDPLSYKMPAGLVYYTAK